MSLNICLNRINNFRLAFRKCDSERCTDEYGRLVLSSINIPQDLFYGYSMSHPVLYNYAYYYEGVWVEGVGTRRTKLA